MERAIVDRRQMQLLYRDGADFVFMDNSTYDQMNVPSETVAEAASFLVDSANADVMMYGDEVIGIELPASVELSVAETEPGIQGDRVSGAKKPATLETGHVVQVPLFIEPGERLKVDTRTGEFISRA
jgi:elongation factor P